MAANRAAYGRVPVKIEVIPSCDIPLEEVYSPTSSLTASSRVPSDSSVNTIVVKDRRRHDRRRERLNTELLIAVIKGDLTQTIKLLDSGASPEATCRPGRVSVCHVAAFKGHGEILANLLMRGANADQKDKMGRQPAHLAAWAGHKNILEILHSWTDSLIEAPVAIDPYPPPCDMDISDSWSHNHDELTFMVQDEMVEGSTPLHLASKKVHTECVNFLLSKGVSIDRKDSQGLTALDVVAVSRDEEPEPDEPSSTPRTVSPEPDSPITSPFDSIAMNRFGREGFFKVGLPHTRSKKEPEPKKMTTDTKRCKPVHDVITALMDKGAKLPKSNVILKDNNVQNQTKMSVTTLHTAVKSKDLELISYLLKKDACMMTWNEEGDTALHLAVKTMLLEPLEQMLGWETERPVVDVRDREGRTPLHLAVMGEWPTGVSLLLENGADVKTTSNASETVLHLAAERGNFTMLEELLSIPDSKKILEYRDHEYCTPLLRATYHNKPACVELLVRNGADTTISLPGDFTLLHIATENNSREIVQYLLRDQTTLERLKNVRCKEERGGLTSLHIAAKMGFTECVEELLEAGCDVLAPTTKSPENLSTALHLAARSGHEDVVTMILDKEAEMTLKAQDGHGWFPLHVAAFSGQGPCVRQMLLHGADIAVNISDVSGKRSGLDVITYSVPQPVQFLEEIFDSYIVTNGYPVNHPECEIEVKYNVLIPQGTSKKQMNVLNAILNSGRQKLQEHLLLHPIVETFLCLKWRKLRNFFFVLVLFYMLLTVSLTSLSFFHYVIKDHSSQGVKIAITISQVVLVISFLPIIITEILNASQLQKYYLKDYETWVKWSVFIGTWAVGMTNPGVWWARYLASITVLLAWIELLFFIARCPSWGYYVLMFSRVAINVFKVLGTFIFLILGFTFSFMIHFEASEPFGSVWEALIKVLIMMIELDYSGTFPDPTKPMSGDETLPDDDTRWENSAAFFILGRAVFATFVILVAIVLTNLMVGLAVSDINLLETQGRTQRLAKQVGFLSLLEFFVYNDLILKCLPYRLRKAVEKRRCVAPWVVIRPATPLGNFFYELPRTIRESVLEKVACQQLRDESVEVGVSLQRLDERVENLASVLGKRRASVETLASKRPERQNEKLEQTLAGILKELKELRGEVEALRPRRSNGYPGQILLEDVSTESGPLLI